MKKRKSNNSKLSTLDGSPGGSYIEWKSPYSLRRNFTWDCLNDKVRLAIVLHCLNGYPAYTAYAIAFNFRGSFKSLGPLASRFFNHPPIRDMCVFFVQYYTDVLYHTNEKFRR